MKEIMANKPSEECASPRPMPAWAGMSAKQRSEIASLKAEIRKMQEAEAKYLPHCPHRMEGTAKLDPRQTRSDGKASGGRGSRGVQRPAQDSPRPKRIALDRGGDLYSP